MSKKESVLFNFTPDTQMKISEGKIAFTLLSKEYKDNQCLVIGEKDANTIQKNISSKNNGFSTRVGVCKSE